MTGRKKLATELGVSEQNIRTALKLLSKLEILTIVSTNDFSIITLKNWDKYQTEKPELTNGLTNAQPTPNQRLTTEVELKEVKALQEESGPNFFTILMDGFKRHNITTTERPGKLIALIQAKGKQVGEEGFRATVTAYCNDKFIGEKAGHSLNGFLNSFDRLYNLANREALEKKRKNSEILKNLRV